MPDYLEFHKSINEELQAVKNRIRNLVTHWETDGEHKEVALRSVLRRHLPESLCVARGFIVNKTGASTQIDILIVDRDVPTLFKDGDLVIVTPEAVRAIIEVKTRLGTEASMREALTKLGNNASMCTERGINDYPLPWIGLFDFDTENADPCCILRQLSKIWREQHHCAINCIAMGTRHFVRYSPPNNSKLLDAKISAAIEAGTAIDVVIARHHVWSYYELDGLAPSYFLGNLIEHLSPFGRWSDPAYAWFPLADGKEPFRKWLISGAMDEPERAEQP